jgi:hypothetical protein
MMTYLIGSQRSITRWQHKDNQNDALSLNQMLKLEPQIVLVMFIGEEDKHHFEPPLNITG